MNTNDSETTSYENNAQKLNVLAGSASVAVWTLPDKDTAAYTDTGNGTLRNAIIL